MKPTIYIPVFFGNNYHHLIMTAVDVSACSARNLDLINKDMNAGGLQGKPEWTRVFMDVKCIFV